MTLLNCILTEGNKTFIDKEFNNDNVYDKFMHEIHPKQIVMRTEDVPFAFYEVKYSYNTVRNNKREGIKYFIFNTYSPEVDIKEELKIWIEQFNKENPNRQLLNVKLLESRCLGYATLH